VNVGATSSADQRAEPGGVDEGNLVEVDDDGAAGVRQREQPVTQSGHGGEQSQLSRLASGIGEFGRPIVCRGHGEG